MASLGACVTKGTSQQDRANKDALISMNVLANPVERELSARTHLEDTGASVHLVSLEIQMLLVQEKSRQSNALFRSHVQVENCALKGNVFAKEGSRGNPLDFAEILMSVHRHLQKNLLVA